MDLCRELGPENVGLSTGDATVNRDAPVLCCTAEVLANIALREGEGADVDDVVMDEFHWYADRDRGVAVAGAAADAKAGALPPDVGHAGRRDVLRGAADPSERPTHRDHQVGGAAGAAGVRLFRDPAAADAGEAGGGGQGAGLRRLLHAEGRRRQRAGLHQPEPVQPRGEERGGEAIEGFRFTSPYGPDVRKWLKQGIGVHHAGLLPKYRVLVEQLTQRGPAQGHLRHRSRWAWASTCRSGPCCSRGSASSTARRRRCCPRATFHQIAGRAGRKGFDDKGFVVAQAPEHFIENKKLGEKAKDGKKVVRRKPPEHNFANWDLQTFQRLMAPRPSG
jgi:hypothetical protein